MRRQAAASWPPPPSTMTSAAVMHPQEDTMQQDISSPLPEDMEGNDGDGRPTLLVTTVDIGEGRAGRIELRLGDDPVDVARAFCARHGLPETIVLPLAQHLEENLAENAAAAAAAAAASDSDGQHPHYAESEGEEEAADEAADEAATPIVQQVEPSTYSEASLGSRVIFDTLPHQYEVETSTRSLGSLGPRPVTAGGQLDADQAPVAAQQQRRPATASAAPSYRPASIHSARGAEYFNRPPLSSRSAADSDGSGLQYRSANHTGGSSGGLPAHNRLYADHFRKQRRLEEERRMRDLETQLKMEQVHIAPVSNKMAGNRNAGSYRNYGERLYVEGRLEAMRREQDAQRLKEDEARTELEQYTFQPAISKMAQQIKHGDGSGGSIEAGQRLYGRAQGTGRRQERMQSIRREQDELEVAECSFRPQINSKSARMMQQRQQILKESGLAGYEQLYNDSARLRQKLQALAAQPPEDATFHPQVNTSSVVLKSLMEGREDGQLGGSADVAARLLERGRRYQEKLAAAQYQAEVAPCDATTGQPLFRPKTYRAPAYERNPEGAPIGEYLYSIKAEWDERAARVRDAKEQRTQQNAASTFVNDRSERLVDRLKRERFRAIFDYLRHGHPAPVLNLLETVQDETFMDTIDPEVRADVEFAGRLLAKSIQRRQAAERLRDCASSAPLPGGGGAMSGASLGPDTTRGSASFMTANTAGAAVSSYGQSTIGELDAAGFVTLMEEVIARTKGLTRQYLLPMPSGRQKFEEPSFRPCIDPRSQALAARLRPDSLPTYELLYKTAEEQSNKREEMRRVSDAAKLKECLFHPVMVTQQMGQEGRAIKLAAELTQSKRTTEGADPHGSGKPAKPAAKAAAVIRTGASTATAAPAPLPAAAMAGTHIASVPSGEQLHFDALERQINEALVRLSMSEEQVAVSLRQAAAEEADAPEQQAPAGLQVGQSVDVNGYRLDWRTICSSPSPEGMLSVPEMGDTPGEHSSMAGFNPLDDDDASAAASCAATAEAGGATTVAWEDASQDVVAHVMAGSSSAAMASAVEAGASGSAGRTTDGELSGLDLHALASTDLSYDALAAPAAVDAAAEGSELAADGGQ